MADITEWSGEKLRDALKRMRHAHENLSREVFVTSFDTCAQRTYDILVYET